MFGGLSVTRCGKRAKVLGAVLMTTTAMVGIVTTPAVAQTASAQRNFDIPAQSLPQALMIFGRQAGLQVTAEGSVTAGKTSAAVSGDIAPAEALSRLLVGTGLTFRFVGNNGVQIEPAPQSADGAIQLGPVRVEGEGNSYAAGIAPSITSDPYSTEGTGSYTTARMRSATKLDLSIRETPQSVTVVTRQRMDDQNVNSINDALQYVPGLTVRQRGPLRPEYSARGFEVDNIMYDGLPSTTTYNNRDTIAAADMALFDRVEIVRGATGLMQGAGNPAAAINLVRKRATVDTQVTASASIGNWDRYRAELDVSGPLIDNGAVRGRMVAAYQNFDSFQDVVNYERILLYGTLEADLGSATTLIVGGSHQIDNNTTGWGSIPVAPDGTDLHLPRSTYLGNDWDYWDQKTSYAFGRIEHSFDNDWKLNLSINRIWGRMDYLATKLYTVGTGYTQRAGDYSYTDDQTSYDAFLSGPFRLLGREHELVLGASLREEKLDVEGGGAYIYSNMDIYDWDSSLVAKPTIAHSFYQRIDENQKGLYATARLSLADPLKLIIGGRIDWYKFSQEYIYGDSAYSVNSHMTKYAGLIYDFDQHHSVYVSYTDIFKPQNYTDRNGEVIDPVVGKNYEIGVKGEYLDGALIATVALFQLDQANRAKALGDQTQCIGYSEDVTCYEAAGKVRSKGVEVEVQGALMPEWQVSAGYTFVDDAYKSDTDPARVGGRFDTATPRHQFKLSSTYRFGGVLDGWRMGGNFRWQSKIYNTGTGSAGAYLIEQGAYALLDLMAGLQPTANLDLQLNLNNLFDKHYYQGITDVIAQGNSVYGAPRNVMLTARYKF